MNKSDLVDALADATGMTKADAARAVDAMFSPDGGVIAKALNGGARKERWRQHAHHGEVADALEQLDRVDDPEGARRTREAADVLDDAAQHRALGSSSRWR